MKKAFDGCFSKLDMAEAKKLLSFTHNKYFLNWTAKRKKKHEKNRHPKTGTIWKGVTCT